MKYFFTVILILSGFYFLNACSCSFEPFSIIDIVESNIVFRGTLKEKKDEDRLVRMEFEIQEMIHGNYNEKTISIFTAISGAACGINIDLNREIILLSRIQKGKYKTSLCYRNKYVDEASNEYLRVISDYRSTNERKYWLDIINDTVALGTVEMGVPKGFWEFYKNGKLKKDGLFSNGQKDGTWNWYRSKRNDRKNNICSQSRVYYLVEYNNGVWIKSER